MKSLHQHILDSRWDSPLYEMANIGKKRTGLNVIVWVEVKNENKYRHNFPRMKFVNSTSNNLLPNLLTPISIEDNPKVLIKNIKLNISSSDFSNLCKWIRLNKDLLIKLWNGEIDSADFIETMKKI